MNIKERSMDIATILMLYTVATMLLFGFIYAIFGTFMPYDLAAIGLTEADIIAFDPELMTAISNSIRTTGYTFISFGGVLIAIIIMGFRKKEKWAYYTALYAVLVIDISLLLITAPSLNISFIIILVNLICHIIAMTITFKDFFRTE